MQNVTSNQTVLLLSNRTIYVLRPPIQLPEGAKIFIFVLISLLVLIIIVGNSIVMLAFIVDKRLRTQSNFFLLNLSICDFFIGAISIPLYSPYKFTKQWKLGKTVCKLWLISDYAMSTASVYNIVLISFDRYLSVTKAVSYRSSQNSKLQIATKMGIVWILSFLLYTPGFFIYEKNQPEYICLAGFNSETKFLLGTSCFDFFLPFLCIAFFNLAIYWNILTRSKKKSHSAALWALDEGGDEKKPYTVFTENAVSTAETVNRKKGLKDCLACCLCQKKAPQIAATNALSTQLARDKKAAKSLAVLVSVFTLCWAPYSILASCREYCQVPYLSDVTTWLLWINSAINPALYPLCHKSFKEAFALLGKKFFSICKGKPSV